MTQQLTPVGTSTLNGEITQFLYSIPEEDVLQLAKTSTSGLIDPDNDVHKAISVILRYSDAVTLLNRRRIKTAYLAKYLDSKQIQFSLPATKTTLSRHVLQYWGVEGQSYVFEEDKTVARNTDFAGSSKLNNSFSDVTNNSSPSPNPTADNNSIQVEYLPNVQLPSSETTGQTLALQFVPWFYNMLNNLDNFNSSHFWPQCNLHLEIIGLQPNSIITETWSGDDTCNLLRNLIEVEKIQFNPNTLNGVGIKGRINPHGLVEIIAYGTAHRQNSQFGCFEQMFSLLRDPNFENNFKMLNTILKFRTGHGSTNPSQSSITSTNPECMDINTYSKY